jgi:hypothetical protein
VRSGESRRIIRVILDLPRSAYYCRRMRTKSRNALRKAGHRLPPLAVVSLRVPPAVWTRCGWAAQAKGTNRQAWVRDTLAYASRDAKPPRASESEDLGSASERAEWKRAAERYGLPVEEFIRQAMNAAVKKLDAVAEREGQE